jgi:hypothetical protein
MNDTQNIGGNEMTFKARTHNRNTGEWGWETITVLSHGEPKNIRGRVTGSNWSVDYQADAGHGFGIKDFTLYFAKKTEALEWIALLKKTA